MTLDDWLESATGQQVVEASARAMCAWDGLTWDEARRVNADSESAAQVYASLAEVALCAALGVRVETPCAECKQTGHENGVLYNAPCPSCSGRGVVSGEPALMEAFGLTLLPTVEARSAFTDTKIEGVEFYARVRALEEETR